MPRLKNSKLQKEFQKAGNGENAKNERNARNAKPA